MLEWIKTLNKSFMQGLLAFMGFGALTWGFVVGRVPIETYTPLVALMVGFFFNAVVTAATKAGGKE